MGVAFRDRNDAFDFGVAFQDEAERNQVYLCPDKAIRKNFMKNLGKISILVSRKEKS